MRETRAASIDDGSEISNVKAAAGDRRIIHDTANRLLRLVPWEDWKDSAAGRATE